MTDAAESAAASANMTVQGYTPLTPPSRQIATNESTPFQCPINSTSPPGAKSILQCVCLPGYTGNAAAGSPCAPCQPGVFCSGGLINLCQGNASAPPMSNSSADCTCNPGFYGTRQCAQCPLNAFCAGGQSTYCTQNAVSPVQSTGPDACYCSPGYAGVANAPCEACDPGTWCWTGVVNQCPTNWTSQPRSTRPTDCYCADGYRSIDTRNSNGGAVTVCVLCSANTYCKVSPKPIYNSPHPHHNHAAPIATPVSGP